MVLILIRKPISIRIDYNHTHHHNYTDLTEPTMLPEVVGDEEIDYKNQKDKEKDEAYTEFVQEVTKQMKDIMNINKGDEEDE